MESSLPNSLNRQGTTPSPMAFDLDAYCARINYTGSRDPTLTTLRGLHFAHAHNVPFENLDIHLGQAISLQPADLFTKIVTRKRGGYCYEVNSFFAMILRAFGFQVHGLLARVLFSNSGVRPRSHQLLSVMVDKEPWIADVGFGSCCLREPLRLTPDVVSDQGPDSFRLKTDAGQSFILEALLVGRWQDLYEFTLEPSILSITSRSITGTRHPPMCVLPNRSSVRFPHQRDESWRWIGSLKFTAMVQRKPFALSRTKSTGEC